MDLLQSKAIASDNFMKQHFQKVEGGMERLNTWMMHLYNMIKRNIHPMLNKEHSLKVEIEEVVLDLEKVMRILVLISQNL